MTKLWVDPPSGWMFGFPKIWDRTIHPDVKAWLVNEGYPQEEINKYSFVEEDGTIEDNFYCRFWGVKDD